MEHIPVKDFQVHTTISGCYVLKELSTATTCEGRTYYRATLADVSAAIPAVMWDINMTLVTPDGIGTPVYIEGKVTLYQNRKQLTLQCMRYLSNEEWQAQNMAELVPTTPLDTGMMLQALESIPFHEANRSKDYGLLTFFVLEEVRDMFCRCPAAMSIHHAYVGGLLTHSFGCLQLARMIYEAYKDQVPIDSGLLYAGAALHDVGKVFEFELSPLGLVQNYTPAGKLEGHPVLGAMLVRKTAERYCSSGSEDFTPLEHLILSHHGSPEYGAAVKPQCIEAELLSYIDGMDSRCAIYTQAIKDVLPGDFTQFHKALGKQLYRVK